MREDSDLEFLKKCRDEDLNKLEFILTKDGDGEARRNCSLNGSDIYKKHYPKHSQYCSELIKELQEYGGHTIMNFTRGTGVVYREILEDACSHEGIDFNKKEVTTIELEERFCKKYLGERFKHLTKDQQFELLNDLNISSTGFSEQGILAALKVGGGLALKNVASKPVTLLLGLGWVANGAWIAHDISGPAYRVTKPAILEIYLLRQKVNNTIIGKIKKMLRFRVC